MSGQVIIRDKNGNLIQLDANGNPIQVKQTVKVGCGCSGK
jgi:hypothetical protein